MGQGRVMAVGSITGGGGGQNHGAGICWTRPGPHRGSCCLFLQREKEAHRGGLWVQKFPPSPSWSRTQSHPPPDCLAEPCLPGSATWSMKDRCRCMVAS